MRVLALAGLLRLLAAIFSSGFLASDDHHVVVTAADQIASRTGLPTTYARSALFPAVIGANMRVTRALGIEDPGVELLIIRILQALYSLLVVYFVYRILERSSGRDSAFLGGLLAALFFAMPVTAVHQLEESVAQVPLLAALWWWVRCEAAIGYRLPATWGALAGAALGTALILRFPLIGFVGAFLALAMLRPAAPAAKLAFLGGFAAVMVLQGYSNALINHEWWYSFTQRLGPMLDPQRMAVEADGYPSSPPWHYILTLLAALIPPASVLLLAAAVKGGRRLPLIGLTALAFLVSHSLIANKQERFLLPILPVLFVLIAAGLPWLTARFGRWHRPLWWYFWGVNAVLLFVVTFSAGKKDRVAPLLYLHRRHDATGVVVAQFNQRFNVPEYYLGRNCATVAATLLLPETTPCALRARPPVILLQAKDSIRAPALPFNYVVLYSDAPEADERLLERSLGRDLTLLTRITPSLADRLAHAINPRHNKARTALVYTTS